MIEVGSLSVKDTLLFNFPQFYTYQKLSKTKQFIIEFKYIYFGTLQESYGSKIMSGAI